jgi:hypothetical protein
MNARISRGRFLALAGAMLLPLAARAQPAADPPEGLMKKMMEAIRARSYDDFIIECDEGMRAALTKQMFDGVAGLMAASLQPGYKTPYLGKLQQKGHAIYLWKLVPATVKDETLIRMAIKDKRVSGFLLQ